MAEDLRKKLIKYLGPPMNPIDEKILDRLVQMKDKKVVFIINEHPSEIDALKAARDAVKSLGKEGIKEVGLLRLHPYMDLFGEAARYKAEVVDKMSMKEIEKKFPTYQAIKVGLAVRELICPYTFKIHSTTIMDPEYRGKKRMRAIKPIYLSGRNTIEIFGPPKEFTGFKGIKLWIQPRQVMMGTPDIKSKTGKRYLERNTEFLKRFAVRSLLASEKKILPPHEKHKGDQRRWSKIIALSTKGLRYRKRGRRR